MGKQFVRLDYEQFAQGMIVGIQTDRPLLNNTILVQKQEHS